MAKKQPSYNIHAAIIAAAVIGGVALAACSPMIPGSASTQDQDTPLMMISPAPTETPEMSPIPTPMPHSEQTQEVEREGAVKGVTTTSIDQEILQMDQAMSLEQ